MKLGRRHFVAQLSALASAAVGKSLLADDADLSEPVHRVANATSSHVPRAQHPLDRGLEIARQGLADCRASINDYTAVIVKRENVDGVLSGHEFMEAKIRNRKVVDGQVVQPMSVYLNFLKPAAIKGREVIFVEGRNDNKMVAHEGGFKGRFLPTVSIPPDGMLAMRGQRYPMTEIGIENLIVKLIERGEQARQFPDVQCEFRKNARVRDRVCTVLHVTLPTRKPELPLFHQAQIFIDDDLNVPIRYVSWDWPRQPGGPLEVIEEYNYLSLKVNVGLTDSDFDPHNSAYRFYT